MLSVILFMGIGLIYSLTFFFILEARSVRQNTISDEGSFLDEEYTMREYFKHYDVKKYMFYYFMLLFVLSIFIANLNYIPNGLNMTEILPYLFITPLLGSLFILLLKWNKQPLIRLFSSIMFSVVFIVSTASAFALSYLVHS